MAIVNHAVRKSLPIKASAERCFKVFTEQIDAWWPRQHHIGQSPLKREVLEARPGGRWYGLSEDGSECEVGKVLVWEPPRRLVLAWQITGQWRYDPAFVTEVEVRFTPEGENACRLDFEHRNLDRYGREEATIAAQFEAHEGWMIGLEAMAAIAERKSYYSVRLIPPRPSFAQDMDDRERNLMAEHGRYWRGFMDKGEVIVFGPVLDPKGVYGLGVVRMESEERLKAMLAGDPSIASGLNTVEYHSILAVHPGQ